jgi:hypothetical protein
MERHEESQGWSIWDISLLRLCLGYSAFLALLLIWIIVTYYVYIPAYVPNSNMTMDDSSPLLQHFKAV